MTDEEREFHAYEDRVMRDCRVYGWLLTGEDSDWGGAMYELGPMEVVMWLWYEAFGLDLFSPMTQARGPRSLPTTRGC